MVLHTQALDAVAAPRRTGQPVFKQRMQAALADALADGGVTSTLRFSRYATLHGADVALVLEGRTTGELRMLAHGFGVVQFAPAMSSEMDRLMGIAMRAFAVTKADIKSIRRTRRIVMARFFVTHWALRRTSMSTTMVGRQMGGRDHTTAIYGRDRWPGSRAEARAIRALIHAGQPVNRTEAAVIRQRSRGLVPLAGDDGGRAA
ncbi:helix-turn-helix domain-containing protein [Hoeflea sp. YIM 152468]|uniref:helix-turn-helix domain-containing protein n=1 Tax=Hoeflea sp. YIM 152468 TaxID=3031759 RepID=UPI0023DCE32F|nr:helix-turn-helix domain-containing protein [Hoeflea sp. YIM 152468]MDF1606975.1 helix-turn-helix domain-containing protein [Hoeflea sp. YIM 152468]